MLQLGMELYNGLEEIDTADYIHSNQYYLQENKAYKNVKFYPCCVEPYPDLAFKAVFKKFNGI